MADENATFDSASQPAVDNAARDAARRDADDNESIRIWMGHPKGRDLLFRLVNEVCHMGELYAAVDDTGRSDTHRTYLHLGERNIGAWIDERLRRFPDLYMRMLQEQQVDREVRLARNRKQNSKPEDEPDNEPS